MVESKLWTISQAHEHLDSLLNLEQQHDSGIEAGKAPQNSLQPLRDVLSALGDPHEGFKVVHITGTNGKGSTASIAANILRSTGLSVGLYTSPHLEVVNERLNWDGNQISDEEFASTIKLVAEVTAHIQVKLSWFETVTVAALTWFSEKSVDVAVVEVGMLGTFDATNVVDADVAVITNVEQDHTDGKPGWQANVATEKAGIIKPDSRVVLGQIKEDLHHIFESATSSEVWKLGEEYKVDSNQLAVGGRVLDITTPGGNYEQLYLELHGAHQGTNVACALAAVEALFGQFTSKEIVEDALAKVYLPGKFETIAIEPTVIFDSAHNAAGAEVTYQTLNDEFARLGSWVLVVALLKERDAEAFLKAIKASDFDAVICTEVDSSRSLPAAELGKIADSLDLKFEVLANPVDALVRAQSVTATDDLVLVSGSCYLVGQLRKAVAAST